MARGVASEEEIRIALRLMQVEEFIRKNKDAAKSVDGVEKSVKKLDATAKQSSGRGSGLGLMSATILSLGTAGISAVAKFGLTATAQLEQVTTGFTHMLKSSAQAKTLAKDLQLFADWTPFESADVNKWAMSLIGAGATVKQVIPTITALGDTVADMGGTPEQVDGALTALVQIAAKAKLSAQELNQLAENKIFARDILSKGLGMSTGALMQFLDRGGTVDSGIAIPILLKGLQEQHAGGMLAQSKTIYGLWSTFKDKMKAIVRADQDSPFSIAIRKWLTGMIADMPGIQAWIQKWFVRLWDLGSTVSDVATRIRDAVKGAISSLQGAGSANGAFGVGQLLGGSVPKGADGMFDQLDKWASSADWFNVGKTVGGKAIGFTFGFLTGIFDLKAWGSFLKDHWWDAILVVISLVPIGKIGGAIGRVLSKVPILGRLGGLFEKAGGALEKAGGPVWKMIAGVGRAIGHAFEKVFPASGALLRRIGRRIMLGFTIDIPNLLRGARNGFGPALERLLTRGFELAFRGLAKAGNWLRDRFVGLLFGGVGVAGPMGALFVAAWDKLKEGASGFLDWLKKGFFGVVNGLIDALNGVLSVQTPFGRVGSSIGHVGGAARGGTLTSDGLVRVGEAGSELLSLPRGASVIPLQRAASDMGGAAGGGSGYHSHPIEVDGRELMNVVHRHEDSVGARR